MVRRFVIGAAGAIVFAAAARRAVAGVPVWDRELFDRVNALPAAIAPAAWLPMQAGALASPLLVGAAYAVTGNRRAGLRVAAAGAATWLIAKAVKKQVRRGRPGDHEGGATLRLGSADSGLGFPSGHAAVVVTVAGLLAAGRGPGPAAVACALSALVGVTRVYVGAHYPIDVIGGWGLGAAIAAVVGPLPAPTGQR